MGKEKYAVAVGESSGGAEKSNLPVTYSGGGKRNGVWCAVCSGVVRVQQVAW